MLISCYTRISSSLPLSFMFICNSLTAYITLVALASAFKLTQLKSASELGNASVPPQASRPLQMRVLLTLFIDLTLKLRLSSALEHKMFPSVFFHTP